MYIQIYIYIYIYVGFPSGLFVKNPPANARDMDLIPKLERFLQEVNGNPLQYSCLENPMNKGAQWARSMKLLKSQTQLSN